MFSLVFEFLKMFYKEEDISNELICPKCTNRFDDPRILPCGNSLCQSCILDEIEEGAINKCYCCQEKHSLPKEGEFTKNKFILKQLEKKPIEVNRGALGELLKKSLNTLTDKKEELENYLKSGDQKVSDYLSEIRTQIDLITETQIERLNKARDTLLEKLKQYQTECMYSKLTSKNDFLLAKMDTLNENITKYLKGTDWNETYVNDQIKEAKNLVDLCSKAKEDFENEIFLNKKPTFIPSKMTLNESETIGKLNFNNLDVIENQKEFNDKLLNKNTNLLTLLNRRLLWIKNIDNLQTKVDFAEKIDCIYRLNDLNRFLWINYKTKLSDSIFVFNKVGANLGTLFDNYDKHILVDTEFHNNFLFLKCRDWTNNMHIFMTLLENNQWSAFLEGGGSSNILNQIHTMAANDTHLYCFYNTQVYPYQYRTNKITRREKLTFSVASAQNGCKIRVDRKFFYVLKGSSVIKNQKSVHIHSLSNGLLSKIILDSNFLDICLVENGLLAGLYCENSNLMINVNDVSDGKLLAKINLNIDIDEKEERKKLKLVSFSEESQVVLDQNNSTMYFN